MPVNTDANSRTFPFTPPLRAFTQSLIVSGDARGSDCVERQLPVLHLAFDYGAALISATDVRDGFLVAQGNALAKVHRDLDAERHAQCLLEGFGAVELSCLADVCDLDADDHGGGEAHYLVNLSDNVHSLCSFGAYAIPQLRDLGWDVTVEEDYPYQVVPNSAPWYADVGSLDERPDWFSLELGTASGRTRLNLPPGPLAL